MEPAQTIITKLGGPGVIADLVQIHRTRVSNWKRPRASGGTDGLIPQRYHRSLLDFASQNAIDLSAEDFLPPRPVSADAETAA